jgi:hypothetical protein
VFRESKINNKAAELFAWRELAAPRPESDFPVG